MADASGALLTGQACIAVTPEEASANASHPLAPLTLQPSPAPSTRRWRCSTDDFWVPGALVFGLAVGLLVPAPDGKGSALYRRVSEVLGWTYFCAWSVSFYPQVVLNHRRRSVVGLSLDYQLLNFAGFACYAVFNASLYWNPLVQKEYRHAHGGKENAVRLNDVFFAIHAAALTLITLVQITIYYDYPPPDPSANRLRLLILAFLGALVVVAVGGSLFIWSDSERFLSWLQYLVILSQVKVAISVFKYLPQVWMNHQRRSTEGWNIYNVLLDFTGGSLSVAQLLLDASVSDDWSAVTGDPAKLMLGNLSMFFDVVFMAQHYCLYRRPRAQTGGSVA